LPGFVNVDIAARADLTLEIGREPQLSYDDSIDLVFSYHE
jgi:hypothetical protein